MGLWILEQLIKVWNKEEEYNEYEELLTLAKSSEPFLCFIDPDDSSFLNPPIMSAAIINYCKKTDQPIPTHRGEFVRCVLESLALKYRFIIDRINTFIDEPVKVLHIVGGGSKNDLLNQFTADAVGIKVTAGPAEATAIGNIMVQAIANCIIKDIDEARRIIAKSFVLTDYFPREKDLWSAAYLKASKLFNVESEDFQSTLELLKTD